MNVCRVQEMGMDSKYFLFFSCILLNMQLNDDCGVEACIRLNRVNALSSANGDNSARQQPNIVDKDKHLTKDEQISKMSVKGSMFVDNQGRTRLFHGFNAVEKGFPWYTAYLLNETKLNYFRDWGFNVVRLGAMWAGVEPEENRYNATYLSILKEIVTKLKERGMYVIFDMHQDVLSSKFGAYDGVPLWVVNKFPPSPHPYPWPLPHKLLQWTDGYLTQAVGRAFQGLYDNYNGTLDDMKRFWSKMADEFSGPEFDNVLGYEFINEPWAGDIYSKPSLLLPGVAGKDNLLPLYDKLNHAIRQYDSRTIIFYEPTTWGVLLNGNKSGTGFDRVPGGNDYTNRSSLSFHYYCWIMSTSNQHGPYPTFQRIICDDIVEPQTFHSVDYDIKRTGGAAFLTEFGLCDPDGHANSSGTIECTSILEQSDQHLVSWTYWDSQFFFKNGSVNWPLTDTFTRTYARAVSGVPFQMHFDTTSNTFQLGYETDPSVEEPTVVFLPRFRYPNGIVVKTKGAVSWEYNHQEQFAYIYCKNKMPSKIYIQIKPKTN